MDFIKKIIKQLASTFTIDDIAAAIVAYEPFAHHVEYGLLPSIQASNHSFRLAMKKEREK